MRKLLTQNSKIKKTSESNGIALFNFGTPALRSKRTGMVTCPMAGLCASACYAQHGAYSWPTVNNAYEERLAISLTDDFIPLMNAEIKLEQLRNKLPMFIRIHDSADYYSEEYFNKWLTIMRNNPNVQFYAYSKMVSLHKRTELPSNYTVIFSLGGKEDSLIDLESDRHSKVFESHESFGSGYINATNDDIMAISTLSNKIGLVYHGKRKFSNTTWRNVG